MPPSRFSSPKEKGAQAIRTEDKEDDTQWLTYWTVYAALSLFDYVLQILPGYYLAKAVFLVYLHLPQTMGAQRLYESVVDPTATFLERYVASLWKKGEAPKEPTKK